MHLHKKIKFGFVVIVMSLLFSSQAHAATFELALNKDIVNAKDDITVLVTINSEGQNINTAQSTISFPSNLLEVSKIDHTNSVFTFWLQEPIFDNTKGTITFVGGALSGLNGAGLKIMQIGFKVKGSGTGRLGVTDGAITASDGTGSNVYTTSKGLDINIPSTSSFQAVTLQRSQQAAIIAKKLPPQPTINIPFYPDPTKWNNRSAIFQAKWDIGSDVIQAGISIDKNTNFNPTASAEALSGNKIFPALQDGISYIHLRVANNIGWGPVLNYRIALDTTPPDSFRITSDSDIKTSNPKPIINFTSNDLTSGIDSYIIKLDDNIAINTNLNTYQFDPLLPGIHKITVSAVDKAGNMTSQTETLEILPITSPVITYINRSLIVDEGNITAGGTSSEKGEILIQVKDSKKQIITEQTIPVDDNGNWNVVINKPLIVGNYNLYVTARNKNMASSLPIISEIINVKQKPMLTIGSLEISQAWFFIDLIFVLLASFGMGWLSYHNWKGRIDRRLTIAQRDVVNVFENTKKDIDKLLKNYSEGDLNEGRLNEIEYTLKKIKENLEKSDPYIIDNIRKIGK